MKGTWAKIKDLFIRSTFQPASTQANKKVVTWRTCIPLKTTTPPTTSDRMILFEQQII